MFVRKILQYQHVLLNAFLLQKVSHIRRRAWAIDDQVSPLREQGHFDCKLVFLRDGLEQFVELAVVASAPGLELVQNCNRFGILSLDLLFDLEFSHFVVGLE